MKKSEMYRMAQGAVITNTYLGIEEKLEILRELMDKEDFEKFIEKEEAKKAVMSE
jgi:hypothetical protein